MAKEAKQEPRYTREQLAGSKESLAPRDVLAAVLEKEKTYTKAEAEKLCREFMEREV